MKIEELKEMLEGMKTAGAENSELVKSVTDTMKSLQDEIDVIKAKNSRDLGGIDSKGNEEALKELKSWIATGKSSGVEHREFENAFDAKEMIISGSNGESDSINKVFNTQLIDLMRDQSVERSVFSQMTLTSPEYRQLVNTGGATAKWESEMTYDKAPYDPTATPSLVEISPSIKKIIAEPWMSEEALRDPAINLQSFLLSELSVAFEEKEGDGILNGTGVGGEPIGFLHSNYFAAANTQNDKERAYGKFQVFTTTAVDGKLTVADPIGLIDFMMEMSLKLKKGYRKNATLVMNSNTFAQYAQLKDANKNYYIVPDARDQLSYRLLGYSIVINENMPDVASGKVPVTFGDHKQAMTICDLWGLSIDRNPYKRSGMVSFYSRKRLGTLHTKSDAVKGLWVL